MSDSDKRTQIMNWFYIPKPTLPWKSIFIGIFIIALGIVVGPKISGTVTTVMILVGLIYSTLWPIKSQPSLKYRHTRTFSLATYFAAKSKYVTRPSCKQMTNWLSEDIDSLKKQSINKVGLDESELITESLVLEGPIYWHIDGLKDSETNLRRWAQEGYLYAVWDVVILHFTENCIAVFLSPFNWLRNVCVNESTEEYFYKDIVTIKTSSESSAYNLFEGKLEKSSTFQISVSSGEKLKVLIDDPQLKTQGASELNSRGEKAVQSLRRMLRDKK